MNPLVSYYFRVKFHPGDRQVPPMGRSLPSSETVTLPTNYEVALGAQR
jgi:hypothetical protein